MLNLLLMLVALEPASASVDGNELQWAICENDPETVMRKLGVRASDENHRKLYYLETQERDLSRKNITIRYRATKKKVKSNVKTQFALGESIPSDLQRWGVTCERDIYVQTKKVGCSAKEEPGNVGDLSANQQAVLSFMGIGPSVISRAKVWGPVKNDEYEFAFANQEFSLDVVYLDRGETLIELSTRTEGSNYESQFDRLTAVLQQNGVELCSEQVGKGRKILDQLMSGR